MDTAYLDPSEIEYVEELLEAQRKAELEEDARYLEEDLYEFIAAAWHIVEPHTPFVHAWHIEAMCEHLEAVVRGEIQRLYITMPPGHAKTMVCSVMYPAWLWCKHPGLRLLTASYDRGFAERDAAASLTVIESDWYQARWPLTIDKNTRSKKRFANEQRGYRVTTTPGAATTGEGGGLVICLPRLAVLQTDMGALPIGEIVERRLPVRVLAYDHAVDLPVWGRIEAFERSSARPLVRITTASGRVVRCTEDHPVWVDGKGYVDAERVAVGDTVRALREAHPSPALRKGSVLLEGVRVSGAPGDSQGEELQAMPAVRHAGLPAASAPQADPGRPVLLTPLPRPVADRREQPRLCWWQAAEAVRTLREAFHLQAERGSSLLLEQLQDAGGMGRRAIARAKAAGAGALRALRQALQAAHALVQDASAPLLLKGLQERSSLPGHAGLRQPELRARGAQLALSILHPQDQECDQGQGRLPLSPVRRDAAGREGPLCPPHRLQQDQQRPEQPDLAVRCLPREGAWIEAEAFDVAPDTVIAVERCEPDGRWVYNVRIGGYRNYFADGLLLHNCDDPISMKDVESPAKRKAALHWWRNVLPTRIRNHQPGAIVMVGQRGHDTDPIGAALKQNLPGSVHLNLPARYDPQYRVDTKWYVDPRTKRGELLWPEVYGKQQMTALTSQMDAFAVASQLQQTPEVDGGAIIKRVWWRKWTEWTLPACEFYLISIDPSIKDEKQHSQWAAQVWGVFPEEERGKERWSAILLYAWAEHLDYPTAKERVLQLYSDWTIEDQPPDEVCIEDKAAGPMILREMDKAGLQNLHGHNPNDGSKIARGNMVADAWRYGRVWVPTKPIKPGQRSETILPSWAKSVVDQCAMVPKSEYDDQFDAATQALARLRDLGYIDLDTDAYATPTSAPDEEPRAVSAYGS